MLLAATDSNKRTNGQRAIGADSKYVWNGMGELCHKMVDKVEEVSVN